MASNAQISAGAHALLDHLGTCNPGPMFNARDVAAALYERMHAMEPVAAAPASIRLKLDTGDLGAQMAAFTRSVDEFKALLENAEPE